MIIILKENFYIKYNQMIANNYTVKDISNKNLNELFIPGVYTGFNVENSPDVNYVQVIITKSNNEIIVQECKDLLDRLYSRSFSKNKWQEWEEIKINFDLILNNIKEHNHDEKYLIECSNKMPHWHNTKGQIWIELTN